MTSAAEGGSRRRDIDDDDDLDNNLVLFTLAGCGPCQHFKPVFARFQQLLRNKYGDIFPDPGFARIVEVDPEHADPADERAQADLALVRQLQLSFPGLVAFVNGEPHRVPFMSDGRFRKVEALLFLSLVVFDVGRRLARVPANVRSGLQRCLSPPQGPPWPTTLADVLRHHRRGPQRQPALTSSAIAGAARPPRAGRRGRDIGGGRQQQCRELMLRVRDELQRGDYTENDVLTVLYEPELARDLQDSLDAHYTPADWQVPDYPMYGDLVAWAL